MYDITLSIVFIVAVMFFLHGLSFRISNIPDEVKVPMMTEIESHSLIIKAIIATMTGN